MASLNDVSNAIKAALIPAFYPSGTSNPSIAGTNVFVAAGNFEKKNLDDGLLNNDVFVEVFAMHGMTRNTTRIRDLYCDPLLDTPTIALAVANSTITLTGTVTEGQVVMVIVNGTGYAYEEQIDDTLDSIAFDLAALIPGATAAANVITVPGNPVITARVSVQGTLRRILHSEEGIFRVRVIARDNNKREIIGNALQIALATLTPRYYLQMPDGIAASIRPKGIQEVNKYELALASVRDYLYLVEYHTVQVITGTSISYPYINSITIN